ncbi:hypothetical protein ACR79B_20795 [Sphingobacterium spiritivorum]|uniref:terminase small subunit-like protein n=1 Tax=Sphingobacterium spiritivorum TaxID=258 RepID=UPI003DA41560
MSRSKGLSREQKEEIVKFLLNSISTDLISLRKAVITAHDHFDLKFGVSTALDWINEVEYTEQYARAMREREEGIFDEIYDISNESNADVILSDKGHPVVIGEAVNRSRIKIDARKWMLGKMNPKKYGERIDVTSDGEKVVTNVINLGAGIKPKEDE